MEQMTVNELFELCKDEIEKGNGDKQIVISDDNEGNGYHGLFYGFTEANEEFVELVYDSRTTDKGELIILG